MSVQTPACDKLASVYDEHMALEEFLDWLADHGFVIGTWVESQFPGWPSRLAMATETHRDILDVYFGIDRGAIEHERRALLQSVRDMNAAAAS